jgi:hypothetical protein
MKKFPLLLVFASLAVVAFLVCGQQALAQENPHHIQAQAMPSTGLPMFAATEPKKLQQLSSGFGVLPALGTDGKDNWPCFGGGAMPDCSSIAAGGAVIGTPAYTQSLTNCNDNTTTVVACGQVFWFYEDDTGDNVHHLFASIVVKQGAKYILDTGSVDLGVNTFAAGTIIVISDDTAFGTIGNHTGPGNGYCAGSTVTCVDPVAGPAVVTVTTTVGSSTIKATFSMFLK